MIPFRNLSLALMTVIVAVNFSSYAGEFSAMKKNGFSKNPVSKEKLFC